MEAYDLLGFTGAIGSTDVTHIRWACCPYSWARQYTGKEGFPSIAYQAIVDHTGRVLAVTKGFAGAMNDKTIIRYDTAVAKIRRDPVYSEKVYTLFDENGQPFERKGNYSIVDNGYNKVRAVCKLCECPARCRFQCGVDMFFTIAIFSNRLLNLWRKVGTPNVCVDVQHETSSRKQGNSSGEPVCAPPPPRIGGSFFSVFLPQEVLGFSVDRLLGGASTATGLSRSRLINF